ncbi:MAG TPA: tail fiber domain-containing protein [Pyrinomonadaceae bacterium]|nr:tail fiber domain-containing protein [Pyrinomonadaceae bacterium]
MRTRILLTLVVILLGINVASAQTTAFTYQGKLADGGNPVNGNYDLTFQLFNTEAVGTGTQQGTTLTLTNVPVKGGVFTTQLDFGACASCFDGSNRFLEIAVRPSGGGAFTTMSPRQPISATPFAIRSLTAGSADNATNATTAANASQLGGVAASQFVQTNDARLSDSRPPTAGSVNYIQNGTSPQPNSNFAVSGNGSVGGSFGAFLVDAGVYRMYGRSIIRNAVNGIEVGEDNGNVGIGWFIPDYKLEIRSEANKGLRVQTNATGGAVASFGGYGDFNIDAPGKVAARFTVKESGALGVGIADPTARFQFLDPGNLGLRVDTTTTGGTVAAFGSRGEFHIDADGNPWGGRLNVKENGTAILGDCPGCFPGVTDRLVVNGTARVVTLGTGGSLSLCRNTFTQISTCSSSLRYKTDLHPFTKGLNLINRLHPLTFRWKADQSLDLGLGAEDVAVVEPLLVTHNEKGEVEGVKYDRLSAVFINAFKEQQTQIERQQAEIKELKQVVCSLRPRARVCR